MTRKTVADAGRLREFLPTDRMKLLLLLLTVFLAAGSDLRAVRGTTLAVEGTHFEVDGQKKFLLGLSYYGALGAPAEHIRTDLDHMQEHGFNWIRVWATWTAFDNDVSAVDADGRPREKYLKRLKRLVKEADSRGMIVDVTLSRGEWLPDQSGHMRAVETLTKALRSFDNVYIDLGNERNIRDARYVSFEELKALRKRVKKLDPDRLVTASHAGVMSRQQAREYLTVAGVDFLSPHRPRNERSPGQTKETTQRYLQWVEDMGRSVPVHYQEPFRRDFSPWQPKAEDFVTDARGAKQGGAAGWCLHNGSPRGPHTEGPRRSFDLRKKTLFEQLDAEEMKAIRRMSEVLDL